MKDFKHFNAVSVDEAVSLLKQFNGKAVVIAGGTDLLGTLKADILPEYPEALINIKTIPDLAAVQEDEDGLKAGALTRLVDIVRSPIIKERYGILAEAAESVASPEIRNMGTIGGNLCQDTRCWYYRYPHLMGGRIQCHRKGEGPCFAVKGDNRYHAILGGKKCFAVCPSDMAIALAAMDAEIRVVGEYGERVIPIMDFYKTLGHALNPYDIACSIEVPRPPENGSQVFLKFRVKAAVDFAVVSVAIAVRMVDGLCKEARIVLGAVAPTPYRAREAEEAIQGKPLNKATVNEAAKAAVIRAKALSQNAYKIEIVKTLVRRALLKGELPV
jgi:xanthine dehydrogenase YagS FAD-binding subunit